MGAHASVPILRVAIYLLTALLLVSTVSALGLQTLHAATTTTKPVTAKIVVSPSTVAKLARAGRGTPSSPYVISLGTVNAKGYTYGILIENVRNVVIEDTKVLSPAKDGIHIVNSSNIVLKHVAVSNTESGSGIYIQGSSNVTIVDSSITGSGWWGVGAINSSNIELARDVVSYNLADGVFMYNVKGVVIDDLRAVANGKKGVYMISCSNIVVRNLYVEGSRDGDSLKLQKCSNILVDGAKLIKAKYWNLCLMGAKNAVVENVYTTGAGWDGIYVGASMNVTIKHCRFVRDTYKGVFIELSKNVTVLSNFIEPGMDVGVNMKGYCMNIVIANNTIVNAGNSGIRVQEGAKVLNLVISGNTVLNSSVSGIDIASAAINVVIRNNTIARNHDDGIYIYTGSSNVAIEYNNISYNGKIGIRIKKGVTNVVIEHNVIAHNKQWAIYIEPGASHIVVKYNEILFNGMHPQAYDDSGATWYGNVWSDYSGKGLYTIAGAAHAVDLKPRALHHAKTVTVSSTATTSTKITVTRSVSTASTASTATASSTTTRTSSTTAATSTRRTTVLTTTAVATVTKTVTIARAAPSASYAWAIVIGVCIAIAIGAAVAIARR
ncbi:MAG: right-handed parallel beta-helix repeat-containing protein [Crenarchaeota archaeon]|nr:right-handed parallel beta-helix repeat-containing protein [Thermoproteota archaeon]